MVRGNGSARAETSVKAATRPNTIRITMRRGPLRDQPRRYKGPVDGTAVLGTPTPATALPPSAARTTSVSRDSLPEQGACPEGYPAPRRHRTDFGDGALVCRVQSLRPKFIECRVHVISEYDSNGRHALNFGHRRRRSFNRFVQPCLKFRIRRIAFAFKTKPVARLDIEIHEG